MGVGRQVNWKGQQRVDVPHLKMVESGIAYDFDTLAGVIIAGKTPYVITGFVPSYTLGADASTLQLATAGAAVMNYAASESGTILHVPEDRVVETLNAANSRVSGGFTASQTNYIGLDFTRSADTNTVDIVQFLDATTLDETPKTIPLARTLDYKIVIATTPFSTAAHLAPICKVVTDANNKIVSVTDSRNLFYRLANGGDSPNALGLYSWPQGRGVGVTAAAEIGLFTGADKAITSLHDWMSAIMTSVWEIKGGERWYSYTSDRDIHLNQDAGNVFAGGENFEWDGTNVHWKGLRFIFANSTASYNDIADQTVSLPGLTDLLDGEVLYVDLNRFANGTVTAAKANIVSVGTPVIPGSRYIFAWRVGANIYTRGIPYPVGYGAATIAGLAAETAARIAGDNTLNTLLAAEVTARTNADALLTPMARTINGYDLTANRVLRAPDVLAVRRSGMPKNGGGAFVDDHDIQIGWTGGTYSPNNVLKATMDGGTGSETSTHLAVSDSGMNTDIDNLFTPYDLAYDSSKIQAGCSIPVGAGYDFKIKVTLRTNFLQFQGVIKVDSTVVPAFGIATWATDGFLPLNMRPSVTLSFVGWGTDIGGSGPFYVIQITPTGAILVGSFATGNDRIIDLSGVRFYGQ